jgi:hypothetical protein
VPRQIIAVHVVVERESVILCLETNIAKKMFKKNSDFHFIQSGRLFEDLYSLDEQALNHQILLCFLL